jgi:cell wall assembly regulator SMI1
MRRTVRQDAFQDAQLTFVCAFHTDQLLSRHEVMATQGLWRSISSSSTVTTVDIVSQSSAEAMAPNFCQVPSWLTQDLPATSYRF